jgi:hypothetical protein
MNAGSGHLIYQEIRLQHYDLMVDFVMVIVLVTLPISINHSILTTLPHIRRL